jgi:3-phenylpropionate/trans-cinnamate dioxygenase ferredoxin reductase subunit
MRDVVVVGGGQAAGRFAEALRAGGYDGRITLLADEPHTPYERPPLSKGVLSGQDAPETTALPVDWAALRIDVRQGARAVAIDRHAQRVTLEDGTTRPWDRLVLATGSRARTLDLDVPSFTLRTLADAAALRARLTPGARLLLLGGGVIGLEVAATAAALGVQAIVVEAAPRLMPRGCPAEIAAHLLALHRARGVDVHLGAQVERVERAGAGLVATLADGTRIASDLLVLGIGAVPEDGLAAAAGLETRDGVLVDGLARSVTDPRILAIGDVARHPLPRFGITLRQESWRHAEAHARAAAAGLLDASAAPYDDVPGFWSDQHGARLLVEGLPALGATTVTREGEKPVTFHLDATGRVMGAATLGDSRAMAVARRLIAAGARPHPALLADASRDLRGALKA